jgi:hypothetical protein
MKAYKGFRKDLTCKEFQYEVGKTYTHDKDIYMCSSGFHCCEHPIDVLRFYPPEDGARYCVVETGGNIKKDSCGEKLVTSKITIVKEITFDELVEEAMVDLPQVNSENYYEPLGTIEQTNLSTWTNQIALGRRNTQTIKGTSNIQFSKINSMQVALGEYNTQIGGESPTQIAKGDKVKQFSFKTNSMQIVHGDQTTQCALGENFTQVAHGTWSVQLASNNKIISSYDGNHQEAHGDHAIQLAAIPACSQQCSGEYGISMNAAMNGRVKLGKNGVGVLTWFDRDNRPRVNVLYEGEYGIKADTWYELGENGEIIEVGEQE